MKTQDTSNFDYYGPMMRGPDLYGERGLLRIDRATGRVEVFTLRQMWEPEKKWRRPADKTEPREGTRRDAIAHWLDCYCRSLHRCVMGEEPSKEQDGDHIHVRELFAADHLGISIPQDLDYLFQEFDRCNHLQPAYPNAAADTSEWRVIAEVHPYIAGDTLDTFIKRARREEQEALAREFADEPAASS